LKIPDQPGLHSETLSQKQVNKKKVIFPTPYSGIFQWLAAFLVYLMSRANDAAQLQKHNSTDTRNYMVQNVNSATINTHSTRGRAAGRNSPLFPSLEIPSQNKERRCKKLSEEHVQTLAFQPERPKQF
jgi:hypothetical protein